MKNIETKAYSQVPAAGGRAAPKRLQNKTLTHAEKVKVKKFLEGKPVAKVPPRTIELKDMSKESIRAAKEAAKEWAKKRGEQRIERTEGEVIFNAVNVDESLSHTISQEKIDALPIIPEIIKNGVTLKISDNFDLDETTPENQRRKNLLIAAPVVTEKGGDVLIVRAIQNPGRDTKFHFHEIYNVEKLKKIGDAFNPAGDSSKAGGSGSKEIASIKNLLHDLLNVNIKKQAKAYSQLPPADRPREKLLARGPAALSDDELLAILLNTGIKGKNVQALACDLLGLLDRNKDIPSVKEISLLAGIGQSKACSVAAMLEFGRRRYGSFSARVKQPSDIFTLVRHYADRKQERFISLSLNGAHEVLAVRIVTIGLVNKTIVHPREVFADLIQDRAAAFCVAHNHPSGQLACSPEDEEITERLLAASKILGLHFVDHVIFSETSFWSFRENGKLGE